MTTYVPNLLKEAELDSEDGLDVSEENAELFRFGANQVIKGSLSVFIIDTQVPWKWRLKRAI